MKQYITNIVGRAFRYKGQVFEVGKVRGPVAGLYTISKTTGGTLALSEADINQDMIPVSQEEYLASSKGLIDKYPTRFMGEMDSLASTLHEQISLVQKDEKYIPQAETINSTAQTIVNIRRAQISAARLLQGA